MQFTGVCNIKKDGQLYKSKEGARLKVGGPGFPNRTAVPHNSGVGFTEEPTSPEIQAVILHGAGDDLLGLDFTSATVTFECDTGQVYLLIGAFRTGDGPELSDRGGEVPLAMSGERLERVA